MSSKWQVAARWPDNRPCGWKFEDWTVGLFIVDQTPTFQGYFGAEKYPRFKTTDQKDVLNLIKAIGRGLGGDK